jgi:hypothetical protein
VYDSPALAWNPSIHAAPQVCIYDRYLYDREAHVWTVDRFLDDLEAVLPASEGSAIGNAVRALVLGLLPELGPLRERNVTRFGDRGKGRAPIARQGAIRNASVHNHQRRSRALGLAIQIRPDLGFHHHHHRWLQPPQHSPHCKPIVQRREEYRFAKLRPCRLKTGQGFHKPGTTGTFGATTAAAKLLGLTKQQMLMAFGLAGSRAGSLSINTGSMTK